MSILSTSSIVASNRLLMMHWNLRKPLGVHVTAPTTTPNEQGLKLTKAAPVSLRNAGLTECWLENEIDKDSTILTLGDVAVGTPASH
jgi:hypothetical protein